MSLPVVGNISGSVASATRSDNLRQIWSNKTVQPCKHAAVSRPDIGVMKSWGFGEQRPYFALIRAYRSSVFRYYTVRDNIFKNTLYEIKDLQNMNENRNLEGRQFFGGVPLQPIRRQIWISCYGNHECSMCSQLKTADTWSQMSKLYTNGKLRRLEVHDSQNHMWWMIAVQLNYFFLIHSNGLAWLT
jgi:hypothetical protein